MNMRELSSILIVGKHGPQPAPTGAMVEVLAKGLFIRNGAAMRLNGLAIDIVAEACT